jgi:signal transduction histidine kinase
MFSLALASPCVMAQVAADVPRTIRVVMDNDYAPYSFQSDEGELEGILVDQWRLWEKKTGKKVEARAMNWGEALRRMRAGEFDVIEDIVETAERQDYFEFTRPYATVEASIYFREDISGVGDLASLKGFPVGVKTGDQHVDQLRQGGVTTVIPFQNNREIVEAAGQHKINVFLVDAPSALYLLNRMGIAGEFRHSAPIFRDELRRAVRKGDASLLREVSEGFAAINPRDLKQIDEKWFGYSVNGYRRYLDYSVYAAGMVILLVAGLAAWNRALGKGILQRTAALQALSHRLVELQESERRQLSRELHDRVGQTLTATRINMDMIRIRLTEQDDAIIRERNDDSLVLIESAFEAIKNVMYELRPPMIDEHGPIVALQWYARKFTDRTGIRVEVRGREERRCAPEIELSLFRIAQEALNNVARHAQARHVVVELRAADQEIELIIEDDGVGFDPSVDHASERIGFGFVTMRERSEALGGTFEAASKKGQGTRIRVCVPRRS